MKSSLVKYSIDVGTYNSTVRVCLPIPEDVYFFCVPGEVGEMLTNDSEHYYTIVRKSDYEEWLESISSTLNIELLEFGEYMIVVIHSLKNSSHIPSMPSKVWFDMNQDIDLKKYVIVNKDDNCRIMNCYRVLDFVSPWNITCSCVTRRDFFSRGEYYSVDIDNKEYDVFVSNGYGNHITSTFLTGEDAEILWNSMIYQVTSKAKYDSAKIDDEYDFDKDYKAALDNFKRYEDIIKNLSIT